MVITVDKPYRSKVFQKKTKKKLNLTFLFVVIIPMSQFLS